VVARKRASARPAPLPRGRVRRARACTPQLCTLHEVCWDGYVASVCRPALLPAAQRAPGRRPGRARAPLVGEREVAPRELGAVALALDAAERARRRDHAQQVHLRAAPPCRARMHTLRPACTPYAQGLLASAQQVRLPALTMGQPARLMCCGPGQQARLRHTCLAVQTVARQKTCCE